MHVSVHVCRKVKKPDTKDNTLCDFVYMKFSKRQNFNDREDTAAWQEPELEENSDVKSTMKLFGVTEITLWLSCRWGKSRWVGTTHRTIHLKMINLVFNFTSKMLTRKKKEKKRIQKHKTAYDLATLAPGSPPRGRKNVRPHETCSTICVSQTWRRPECPSVRTGGQNGVHPHCGMPAQPQKGMQYCYMLPHPRTATILWSVKEGRPQGIAYCIIPFTRNVQKR